MASPKVHFLRLDSIPSCNGFHTILCIDSIHAFRRDLVREFKSIRKHLKISFLSALHMAICQKRSERKNKRKQEISRDFSRFFAPTFFKNSPLFNQKDFNPQISKTDLLKTEKKPRIIKPVAILTSCYLFISSRSGIN